MKKINEYKAEPLGLLYAWNLFKRLIPTMVVWFGLFYVIVFFRLEIWQTLLLIYAVQICAALYTFIRFKRFDLKTLINGMGQVTLVIGLVWFFWATIGVKYVLIGYISYIIIFAVYRLIRSRKTYIKVIRDIESHLWGKPLEKKYWKKNEWRNRKNG